MKNYIFVAGLFVMFFSACERDPGPKPEPYTPNPSSWTVNNHNFITYYGVVNHAASTTTLSGSADYSDSSSFLLSFHLPDLPQQGDYLLNCGSTDSTTVCLELRYLGFHYYATTAQSVYIHADTLGGKAKLILDPVWFFNELNPDDSITVSGIFRQP